MDEEMIAEGVKKIYTNSGSDNHCIQLQITRKTSKQS